MSETSETILTIIQDVDANVQNLQESIESLEARMQNLEHKLNLILKKLNQPNVEKIEEDKYAGPSRFKL